LTDAFTREAVAFIDKHQKQPFFLVAAYNAPHAPLEAPDKYISRVVGVTGGDHRRRIYAAMITAIDDGVGAIQAKLQSAGVLDNTLIFFLSDNGGITGYLSPSSNAPLIGAKTELLEGGIRVPYFVQWPAKLPASKIFQPMVSVLDITPTVLAAAGVTTANNPAFDGVDLVPYLTGKNTAAPHETLFWRYGPLWAIREGNYKLLKVRDDPAQLFDLANDIGENRDLSAARLEIVDRLKSHYDNWNSELISPAWSQPNTPPWW
jgi:arylsulfatase A-like enzyme